MRVAFLAPEFIPSWGGIGVYSLELIRSLLDEGVEIHVITPQRGKGYNSNEVSGFLGHRARIHNVSCANDNFFYNIKFQIALLRTFHSFHKKYKFDIIHAANLVNMPDFYLKFTSLNIPSVTTVHTTLKSQSHFNGKEKVYLYGSGKTEKLTNLLYPGLAMYERMYLKRTYNLIAVSKWITGFIPSFKSTRLKVIHNGIDTEKFSLKASSSLFSEKINRIKEQKVLYTGRLLALKGMSVLAETIKRVIKEKEVHFVIAGNGDAAPWKKTLEGIPERYYTFLGYVPHQDMPGVYTSCNLFVLPSLTESFPLAVLEAMSCGLPVVASNVGGLPEIIDHNRDGFLIKPNSTEELTQQVLHLLAEEGKRKTIGFNARKKVVESFNMKRMGKQTKKFYEEIIHG